MVLTLVFAAALLVQTPHARQPVGVWRSDSTLYVTLRQPGDLLVLHVDANGRIQVLFPASPDDGTAMLANDTLVVIPLPPTAEGNPATFIAVRSRWAFDFAALRTGSTWNYYNALLLQPTAGDPLAALLDIADRVTDGRPYDFGVVAYTRAGVVEERRVPRQPLVCLSCVRRGTAVAEAPAAVPTTAVDCSNASLTNSFCGVANAAVSISSVPQVAYQPVPPAPAPAPVYVPYYLPIVVHGAQRRFERPILPASRAPQPSAAIAFPIAPRLVVPSTSQLRTFGARRP
ncbi:MAG TPA: hypothetical protein VEK77_06010 [Gemmatimonadales bacterium]|nr:hypothetical protein [Gemmatimonadales bacterium]